METNQQPAVRAEVNRTCRRVLDLLIVDLTKVTRARGVEGTEDIPFLKGLQHHANTVCRLYSESEGDR